MDAHDHDRELAGGCACGLVHYRIAAPVRSVVNCHCQGCRQRNGSAFSTYCVVAEDALRVVTGGDGIASYQLPDRGVKYFCRQCGSPLYSANVRYPGWRMVYLGSMAGAPELAPAVNVYCESKLAWVDAIANLKSFPQGSQK